MQEVKIRVKLDPAEAVAGAQAIRTQVPAREAAARMRCDVCQAVRRLNEARRQVLKGEEAVTPAQAAVVALLTHSGAARPQIGRRRWPDFVTGARRVE